MEVQRRRGRLATWVVRERNSRDRRWSVEQAARQAGISRITWERVERAQKVQDKTYDAVERAFHLKPGGCEAIMAGREPEVLDEPVEPESEPEPEPEPEDPYVADLQERYGLDPTGAAAAAAVIRALRPNGDNSANPGIREA